MSWGRRIAWLLVGLVLGGVSTWAAAYAPQESTPSNCYTNALTVAQGWCSSKTLVNGASFAPGTCIAVGTYHGACPAGQDRGSIAYCQAGAPLYDPVANGCYAACAAGKHSMVLQKDGFVSTQCVPDCPPGQVNNSATGLCEPPPCEAGAPATTTVYRGYVLTNCPTCPPDAWSYPATGCTNNCQVGLDTGANSGCVLGESGPPFNIYCTFAGTKTGAVCNATDVENSNTNRTPPPCPTGTKPGTVNGREGCWPAGLTTTTTDTTENPDGSKTTTTTQNNPDGSTITTTTNTSADGKTSSTTIEGAGTSATGGAGSGSGTGSSGEGDSGHSDKDETSGESNADNQEGTEDTPDDNRCQGHPELPECQGRGGNFGGPASGGLYQTKMEGKTFSTILTGFTAQAQQIAVVQGVSGFFSVGSIGGACSVFGMTVPYLNATVSSGTDYCGWPAWDWIGGAIMILAAWVAFRIAIL